MKYERLTAGTLFRAPEGTEAVKLDNGAAVTTSSWRILPYGPKVRVTPLGRVEGDGQGGLRVRSLGEAFLAGA